MPNITYSSVLWQELNEKGIYNVPGPMLGQKYYSIQIFLQRVFNIYSLLPKTVSFVQNKIMPLNIGRGNSAFFVKVSKQ